MGNSVTDPTVISKCLSFLNVLSYRSILHDHRTQKLTTGKAIALFVEAQLQKRTSLSQIADHLASSQTLQRAIDLESISDAQLSRKLNALDTDILQALFLELVHRLHETHSKKQGIPGIGKVRVIDSSEVLLPPLLGQWTKLTSRRNVVKLHTQIVIEDAGTVYPERVIATTAKVSDGEISVELVKPDDAIYVMDRGYVNYRHYKRWSDDKARFVGRIRDNNRVEVICERPLKDDAMIQRDADVIVRFQNEQRDMVPVRLRLVEYEDDKGRWFRLLTNVWDLPAEKISEIYRYRWQIELFFKWIKQHLNLVKLHSSKPESIWNQIFLALISYCLVLLVHQTLVTKLTPWEVQSKLKFYVTAKWSEFVEVIHKPPRRKSKGRRKVTEEQPRAGVKEVRIVVR